MSAECAVRLWLGWRSTQLAQSDSGWTDFTKSLAETFIPATWEVMGNYGLQTYVPSIFRPSDVEGLPDEVALLCYVTKEHYEASKKTELGRNYAAMHRDIFEFKQDGRISKADWSDKVEDYKPYLTPPEEGGTRLYAPDASIYVLLLSSPKQPLSLQAVRDALSGQKGDIAVWIQHKFAVLWLASSTALEESQLRLTFAATIPGAELVTMHRAEPAPPIDQKNGIPVVDNHSWHFHR